MWTIAFIVHCRLYNHVIKEEGDLCMASELYSAYSAQTSSQLVSEHTFKRLVNKAFGIASTSCKVDGQRHPVYLGLRYYWFIQGDFGFTYDKGKFILKFNFLKIHILHEAINDHHIP